MNAQSSLDVGGGNMSAEAVTQLSQSVAGVVLESHNGTRLLVGASEPSQQRRDDVDPSINMLSVNSLVNNSPSDSHDTECGAGVAEKHFGGSTNCDTPVWENPSLLPGAYCASDPITVIATSSGDSALNVESGRNTTQPIQIGHENENYSFAGLSLTSGDHSGVTIVVAEDHSVSATSGPKSPPTLRRNEPPFKTPPSTPPNDPPLKYLNAYVKSKFFEKVSKKLDPKGQAMGRYPPELFVSVHESVGKGIDTARTKGNNSQVKIKQLGGRLDKCSPFGVMTHDRAIFPASDLGHWAMGEFVSTQFFETLQRKRKKILSYAECEAMVQITCFRRADALLSNQSFLDGINCGLHKHAIRYAAEQCLAKDKRAASKQVVNEALGPKSAGLITIEEIDEEINKILLQPQIDQCIQKNRVDKTFLESLYEESDDMHFDVKTFTKHVRDFAVQKVGIEAARRFVIAKQIDQKLYEQDFVNHRVHGCWIKSPFLKPFWNAFDEERDRFPRNEHPEIVAIHADYLLLRDGSNVADSVPAAPPREPRLPSAQGLGDTYKKRASTQDLSRKAMGQHSHNANHHKWSSTTLQKERFDEEPNNLMQDAGTGAFHDDYLMHQAGASRVEYELAALPRDKRLGYARGMIEKLDEFLGQAEDFETQARTQDLSRQTMQQHSYKTDRSTDF